MAELELVGIHGDGEHVVLVDEEGQRHRLPIDDALRAAVRRDRPQLEQIRSEGLRPRDIQVLIRGGASAEDVAAQAGVPVEHVRRYEGPALAERAHVSQRAQALSIGREPGSPTLGDLVVDRLAARGAEHIDWDARRHGSEPWQVIARFVAGDRDREATWQVDLAAGTVVAVDDESRWLSETDLATGPQRRHLSAVRGARLYDVETDADLAPTLAAVDAVIRDPRTRGLRAVDASDASGPRDDDTSDAMDEESEADTEALLEELSAARGVRQRVEIDDDALAEDVLNEDAQAHTPALWDDDPPAAHPPASRPDEATDTTVVKPRRERRAAKNRRTSVPSWDEIVFGARNDQ
jgi:hypothetical protein